jgi:DNA-binding LytR/AlgR family response regulator
MTNQHGKSFVPQGVQFHCAKCAMPLKGKHQNYIIEIPAVGGKLWLMVCNISYIKADGNYVVFHFFDQHHSNRIRTLTCRTTLKSWECLACIGLQRVRDNYIVNLTKVYFRGDDGLIQFNGQDENEVYITEKYEAQVAEAIKIWNPLLAN